MCLLLHWSSKPEHGSQAFHAALIELLRDIPLAASAGGRGSALAAVIFRHCGQEDDMREVLGMSANRKTQHLVMALTYVDVSQ